MIKVERALPTDRDEIIEVSNRIFAGEDQSYFQTYHPALYKDGVNTATDHLIIREDGKIKGLVGCFPSVINVLGEKIQVGGIGTMCVERECRGKGYMREIMEELIRELKKDKTPLSILGGRRQRYEYYGYTPAAICSNFYFNNDNAKHVFKNDSTTVYTFIEPNGSEKDLFEKCIELYQRRPAYIERTAEGFYDCLINCRGKALLIYKNGVFDGYASVSDSFRDIHEFEISDNNDSCRMLKDYIQHFNINGVSIDQIFQFERVKLNALARICEGVHVAGADSYLIQDFQKLINAFAKLKASYVKIPDGSFVVQIDNGEKIKVSSQNNNVSAIATDEEADITLTSLEAISAFFGLGAINLDICEKLPALATALFPLPLFFSIPDLI